jgi:hypothetical protein
MASFQVLETDKSYLNLSPLLKLPVEWGAVSPSDFQMRGTGAKPILNERSLALCGRLTSSLP